jgi:hypothetical protein
MPSADYIGSAGFEWADRQLLLETAAAEQR